MRALFSGVTGIRSHQVRMDVIGNNIANVNTVGFKSSRVTFGDVFSQTISAGSPSTTPQQVGLCVGVATTDLNQSAGSFQMTGRDLDIAIEGNGLFILRSNDGVAVYTRAGNFDWDSKGHLVNPATGQLVQGWTANQNGEVDSGNPAGVGDIQMIRGDVVMASPTTHVSFGQNLDAGSAVGSTYDTAFTAYDSLGRPQPIAVRFTKDADNQWSWRYQAPGDATFAAGGTLDFNINNDGTLPTSTPTVPVSIAVPGAATLSVEVNVKAITQAFAGSLGSTVLARESDGRPMGTLESMYIDPTGILTGVYTNGYRRVLAQLAMANFANPSGLLKTGATAFSESAASGAPEIGRPAVAGRGRLVPGNLEMSNVDISAEFTNMMMTQRGFQANTRIISASDEMVQDLVNLRR